MPDQLQCNSNPLRSHMKQEIEVSVQISHLTWRTHTPQLFCIGNTFGKLMLNESLINVKNSILLGLSPNVIRMQFLNAIV
jgi:hypothetical protein